MNHTLNNITIVCYDITSDKLRREIDKCMKDFGIRVQYSVFLCSLDSVDIERCRDRLLKVLNKYDDKKEANDSLIIFGRVKQSNIDCLLGNVEEQNISKFLIL